MFKVSTKINRIEGFGRIVTRSFGGDYRYVHADVVGVSDQHDVIVFYDKISNEIVGVSELILKNVAWMRPEEIISDINLIGRVEVDYVRSNGDTSFYTETSKILLTRFYFEDETVSLSETTDAASNYFRFGGDTNGLSEIATKSSSYLKSLGDTGSVNDSSKKYSNYQRHIDDFFSLSENTNVVAEYFRFGDDVSNTSEIATKSSSYLKSTGDTSSFSEDCSYVYTRIRKTDLTSTIGDSQSKNVIYSRPEIDIINSGETSTKSSSYLKSTGDTSSFSEDCYYVYTRIRKTDLTSTVNDDKSISANYLRYTVDTIPVVESPVRWVVSARSSDDENLVNENAFYISLHYRGEGITVTPSDGITVVITYIPLAQQQKLVASDAEADDYFGYSVSIDGDTVVVGAYQEDPSSASDAGSAYVFVRSGGVWTQQQKLNASDAQASDYFGYSVSIDGDTIVVGAYQKDPSSASNAGSAYVFVRSGGVWTQQQKLNASDAQAGDYFGYSVSIDGDTIIVGAWYEDPSSVSNAGSAYVFTRSGGVWTQQQKLNASDAQASDYFGNSVAISGDTAIIGARYEDPSSVSNAGSAYVFVRSGGVWTQQQKLNASDAQADDYFGSSVAISGDTAIIGARYEDPSSASDAGSAYVFVRSGGVWTQQQKLNASDAQASDYFGYSVSIDGDTIVVGAYAEDPSSVSNAGSAYVFTRSGGVWTQQQKIVASDAGDTDLFGVSVAIDGDTVVVGAYQEDPSSTSNAGSAYVFAR